MSLLWMSFPSFFFLNSVLNVITKNMSHYLYLSIYRHQQLLISTSTCLYLQIYEKKNIFTNDQICKEGKQRVAVASFLSNAMLVGKWLGPVWRNHRTSPGKLDRSGGRRHLRGMNFLTNEQWLQHQYAQKGSSVSFVIGQRQTQGSCTSSIESFQSQYSKLLYFTLILK